VDTEQLVDAFASKLRIAKQRRTQAETGAVLSVCFSQEMLNDKDKWDSGRMITIAVINNKEDQVGRTLASTSRQTRTS